MNTAVTQSGIKGKAEIFASWVSYRRMMHILVILRMWATSGKDLALMIK